MPVSLNLETSNGMLHATSFAQHHETIPMNIKTLSVALALSLSVLPCVHASEATQSTVASNAWSAWGGTVGLRLSETNLHGLGIRVERVQDRLAQDLRMVSTRVKRSTPTCFPCAKAAASSSAPVADRSMDSSVAPCNRAAATCFA
jgi:hypothetical protein